MLSVRTSDRDKRRRIKSQQDRDERMRVEREERTIAHEASQQALRERGEHERTQATGEFGLARQKSANIAGLEQAQLQQTAETGRAGMRETGETGRAGMRQTGETGRATMREAGMGTRQQIGIGAQQAATKEAESRSAREFHRDLGAKAYLGGQDPAVAQQLERSGEWGTDYQGLKPYETPSEPKVFDPVYSKEEVPRLITPGGLIDKKKGTRTYFEDEETIKALIKKLKEQGE